MASSASRYINQLWGAGPEQDAYQAAFKLPDLLAYFLIGGAASISLITILNRYRERGDEEGGDRALSVILTTMLVVLGGGILLGEIFAPQFLLLANKGFRKHPETLALCVHMTRIILPAQLFFFIGSVMGSRLQVRKIFIYQAFAPLIYNSGIILGALLFHRQLGVSSLSYGVLAGMHPRLRPAEFASARSAPACITAPSSASATPLFWSGSSSLSPS